MGQEKKYTITYHRDVPHDIAGLDSFWHEQILRVIEEKILVNPEIFGKPLRRSLKGYRTLRVGDYRVVFRIEKTRINVIAIIHRSEVYKEVGKRI